MLRNLVHKLSGLVILSGVILIIGTAGSSDLGVLEFSTIVYRCLIGLGLIGIGAGSLKMSGYSMY